MPNSNSSAELQTRYIRQLSRGIYKDVVLDKTPKYMALRRVPKLLSALFPNITVVFILRDPVSRAYSAYNMYKDRFGTLHENSTFEAVVDSEIDELGNCSGVPFNQWTPETISEEVYWRCGKAATPLWRGIYYFQIKNWLKHFSKTQIFILGSSEFNRHTKECTEELIHYFGLPQIEIEPIKDVGSA